MSKKISIAAISVGLAALALGALGLSQVQGPPEDGFWKLMCAALSLTSIGAGGLLGRYDH